MTFKPLLAIVLLVCVGIGPAFAQEVAVGVKGGVNLATIPALADAVDEPDLDTTWRTGIALGGFVAFAVGERFDIQPEVLYVQKGIRFEGSMGPFGGESTVELDYIEVPVLAVFRFAADRGSTGYVFGGPAFAFNTGARVSTSGIDEEPEIDDMIKDSEFSLVFGGGVSFGRLLAEARWTEGLTAIDDAGTLLDEEVRNRAVTFLFGVRF
jgi:hypothetical protein